MPALEMPALTLTVLVPAHNACAHLERCLAALAASARPAEELLLLDDGSTDRPQDLAAQYGATYVRVGERPAGPAAARNLGARLARGDVLVFVDSDVAVHADTLARIAALMSAHPELDALFGSYDAAPFEQGLVSRYKNLLHHYVHQNGVQEAGTFWAGCGAIRREVFLRLDGFSERYARPSIEDIELGMRLRAAGGHIWLCPEVQAKHLKRWTLLNLIRTDILSRALPWGRLVVRQHHIPHDLNLNLRSRASAALAWLGVLCLVGGTGYWPLALAGAGCLAALGVLNRGLYAFFARCGGWRLALGGAGLHVLYLLYSSAAFGLCLAEMWLEGRVTPPAPRADGP